MAKKRRYFLDSNISFLFIFKDAKTVVLEDLAAHFKMKAQDTIDRVTQLLEQGHITGVMDDRGKFIYISQVGNHIRYHLYYMV